MFDLEGTRVFVEVDGKKVEFKNWKITRSFENSEPICVISDEPIKRNFLCDCGAEKAKTTHTDWCSTRC